jgi:hypothetical protein
MPAWCSVRRLLNLQEQLARLPHQFSNVRFEAGVHEPRRATLQVVKRAFEAAGVEFLDPSDGGAGLRLAKSRSKGK